MYLLSYAISFHITYRYPPRKRWAAASSQEQLTSTAAQSIDFEEPSVVGGLIEADKPEETVVAEPSR